MLRSGLRGCEADAAKAWARSVALKFMLRGRAEGLCVRVRCGRVDVVGWDGIVVCDCCLGGEEAWMDGDAGLKYDVGFLVRDDSLHALFVVELFLSSQEATACLREGRKKKVQEGWKLG